MKTFVMSLHVLAPRRLGPRRLFQPVGWSHSTQPVWSSWASAFCFLMSNNNHETTFYSHNFFYCIFFFLFCVLITSDSQNQNLQDKDVQLEKSLSLVNDRRDKTNKKINKKTRRLTMSLYTRVSVKDRKYSGDS